MAVDLVDDDYGGDFWNETAAIVAEQHSKRAAYYGDGPCQCGACNHTRGMR
jgi:hypothetical protein